MEYPINDQTNEKSTEKLKSNCIVKDKSRNPSKISNSAGFTLYIHMYSKFPEVFRNVYICTYTGSQKTLPL